MKPLIIIGTGIAAYTLAREFRKLDSESQLILISADDGRSYPKPMLSNALTKNKTADEIALFSPEEMAEKLNAEILIFTEVISIEPLSHTLLLTNKEGRGTLSYKQLILALGAHPIQLSIEGNAKDELLSINDLTDYTTFRKRLVDAKHIAIIGPGLIGCEFANDLANAGITTSIIGPGRLPMDNLLPREIAEELMSNLKNIGVKWHLSTTVKSVNKADIGYHLSLENGTEIYADLVLSAIGLHPNIALADNAGLKTNRGIITDEYLQTSANNIYALGDCAEVLGHNLLFIAPITAAAKALAKTLSGSVTAVKYPAMPVGIKTPCYPLVVASPAREVQGEWQIEVAESGFGLKALFMSKDNSLLGFALSGDLVTEKRSLTIQLPNVL